MKRNMLFSAMTLLAGSLIAADSSPKDDVTNAAKKLGEKDNYSWKTTVVVPEGSRFRPGPTEGKAQKDGLTDVTWKFGDTTTHALLKGEKAAVTNPEGEWQALSEIDSEGPGRFVGGMVRNLKKPPVQAAELVSHTKDLKMEGDTYSGDLTEEGATTYVRFGRGGDGQTVSNAKGTVKFWLKDGVLSKYEYKVKGTITFNGTDREVDRATTVEIKDVGTTKVDLPAEAKKKLS
jgi:hypothetical protein